jgi:PhoPQ-activated pathogenicity-related protein
LATLAVFFRHVAGGIPGPKIDWTHSDDEHDLALRVQASPSPKDARLWIARSPSKDFRKAKWRSESLARSDGGFLAKVPKPSDGHVAFYGELLYEYEGVPCSVCTLVRRH